MNDRFQLRRNTNDTLCARMGSSFAWLALAGVLGCSAHGGHRTTSDGGIAPDGGGGGVFSSIPNPALVVANGGAGSVSIVDPATLSVVGTLPVASGLHPHHIALSPDRSRVLITATSADLSAGHRGHGGHGAGATTSVYAIDLASRRFERVLDVTATAHNAAFTRDGATIVLAMLEHGMIAGYDARTYGETFTATGFSMPLEVTPTNVGLLLVAESDAGRIALFDLATRRVTQRIDVGTTPVAAWASGTQYFVSVEGGKRVRHLVEGNQGVTMDAHTIDPGGVPGQAVLTRDGSEVWVAVEDRGVVAIFNAFDHAKLAEIPAGTKPHGIAAERLGARVFVTDEGGSGVLVIDAAARTVTQTISVGAKPNGILWLER